MTSLCTNVRFIYNNAVDSIVTLTVTIDSDGGKNAIVKWSIHHLHYLNEMTPLYM